MVSKNIIVVKIQCRNPHFRNIVSLLQSYINIILNITAMSGRKKVSKSSSKTSNFASKYVGDRLDVLIAQRLPVSKYPKTVRSTMNVIGTNSFAFSTYLVYFNFYLLGF
jgi:hypothetical protein